MRGDAVEAEAVEAELLEPVADVGEQEAADLVAAVVEALRVPRRVLAALAGVEVLVAGAVEVVEALGEVLDGVGVDDVQQDGEAEAVGGVDEVLEVLGRAEARGRGEEVRDVVAEGAVVGVLLDGHELDGVVAGAGDARAGRGPANSR